MAKNDKKKFHEDISGHKEKVQNTRHIPLYGECVSRGHLKDRTRMRSDLIWEPETMSLI